MTNQEKAKLLATVLPLIVDRMRIPGHIGDRAGWSWSIGASLFSSGSHLVALKAESVGVGPRDIATGERTVVEFVIDMSNFDGKPRNAETLRAGIRLAVSRLYDGPPREVPAEPERVSSKPRLCVEPSCSLHRTRGELCEAHAEWKERARIATIAAAVKRQWARRDEIYGQPVRNLLAPKLVGVVEAKEAKRPRCRTPGCRSVAREPRLPGNTVEFDWWCSDHVHEALLAAPPSDRAAALHWRERLDFELAAKLEPSGPAVDISAGGTAGVAGEANPVAASRTVAEREIADPDYFQKLPEAMSIKLTITNTNPGRLEGPWDSATSDPVRERMVAAYGDVEQPSKAEPKWLRGASLHGWKVLPDSNRGTAIVFLPGAGTGDFPMSRKLTEKLREGGGVGILGSRPTRVAFNDAGDTVVAIEGL